MPGTKRKAQTAAGAPTAPSALPELPKELWESIFECVRRQEGNVAQLRLVNKLCAKQFAYWLYAEQLDRQFEQLKQKRLALVASRNARVSSNDARSRLIRQSNNAFGQGMRLSDVGLQHLVWNVICLYNSKADDDALRAGRWGDTQGRLALLKMCTEAMHALLQSSYDM